VSNAYETAVFVIKHRRAPRFSKTGYLNDLLFNIRTFETDYVFRSFSADKDISKLLIRGIEGEDLSVPTLAVLHHPDEVDSVSFPDNCIIKPTHMSGEVVFHETGAVSAKDRAKMRGWFTQNFGILTGERHYQRLVPKIIVEPWLRLNGAYCNDYRFYVFQGEVKVIEVKLRMSETDATQVMLLPDWSRLEGTTTYGGATHALSGGDLEVEKPDCLDRMVDISQNVGKYLDFVRVDFFSDAKDVFYVGEISHISGGAREVFHPVEIERLFTK